MATVKQFEDLEIWQNARRLNKDIYPFFQSLIENKFFELYRQMERSAGSIMDNIAEGFDRDGNRELIQFLAIAKASAAELRSQLYRALDRELIDEQQFAIFQQVCLSLGNQIGKFISYLKSSAYKGKKFAR
jgi:four helix bundle protein